MLFNSYSFLFVFLPITLVVFFAAGRWLNHTAALAWLVAASLFFYAWWNPAHLTLILISMLFNYALGTAISRAQPQSPHGRALLTFGITLNLIALGYYKYTNFIIDTANQLFGWQFVTHAIVLPLAVSFFTFHQIAYLVDAYRGETREYNFLKYALYVVYFPQLIAGPIQRPHELLPQFAKPSTYHFNLAFLLEGITYFSLGLFKKVILADGIAPFGSSVFNLAASGKALTLVEAWCGVLAYTYHLYFDFSGYSDMAIGLGLMVGVRLPINFNSPYKALNITEFWRRWHITLSRFLRDYLYVPLGGNRKGKFRQTTNLLITMLLGGFWHGAGWTYIIWGGLHGLFLVVDHAWRRPFNRFFSRGLTFFCVMIAWVFFRSENLAAALTMLRGLFGLNGVSLSKSLTGVLPPPVVEGLVSAGVAFQGMTVTPIGPTFGWIALLTLVAFCFPNTQEWMQYHGPLSSEKDRAANLGVFQRFTWKFSPAWAVATGLLAAWAILGLAQKSEFLYFQF